MVDIPDDVWASADAVLDSMESGPNDLDPREVAARAILAGRECWRPIETANKDEIDTFSPVLLACGGRTRVGFWDDDKQAWLDAMNHDGFEHAELKPTHWMPFPAPPEQRS